MGSDKNHLAVMAFCVTDLAKSVRFYCEALGFRALMLTVPDEGRLGMKAQFLELDGKALELVQMDNQPPVDILETPLSRRGILSHLAFNVSDQGATMKRICELGGQIVEGVGGPVELEGFGLCEIVFAKDPDGIWIELISIDEKSRLKYIGMTD